MLNSTIKKRIKGLSYADLIRLVSYAALVKGKFPIQDQVLRDQLVFNLNDEEFKNILESLLSSV